MTIRGGPPGGEGAGNSLPSRSANTVAVCPTPAIRTLRLEHVLSHANADDPDTAGAYGRSPCTAKGDDRRSAALRCTGYLPDQIGNWTRPVGRGIGEGANG